MSKNIFLGYYNGQVNDGIVFHFSKKDYRKNVLALKKRKGVPNTQVLISMFVDNFRKFYDKGGDLVADRLQVVFCKHDIEKGFYDDNFKFLIVSEDGQNFFFLNGYRETREEILEIYDKVRTLDYESFKKYWTEVCENELVVSEN